MRLRNSMVMRKVLEGGVVNPSALPTPFTDEVTRVGDRPGHYQAFLNLVRHLPLWRKAHAVYGRIKVPVLLVYGDRDWAREAERQETLENGGHFLTFDQPETVVEHIRAFAGELQGSDRA